MKQVFTGGNKHYKSFLHYITKDKPSTRNVLNLNEPRKKVNTLRKEQAQQATKNIRDKFLIQLLYETGFRIGEGLALFMEDFILIMARDIEFVSCFLDGFISIVCCYLVLLSW